MTDFEQWLRPYTPPKVVEFDRDHALTLDEYSALQEWARENNADVRVPPHLRPLFPVYIPQANLNDVGKDVDGYRPYIAIAFIVAVMMLILSAVVAVVS